LHGQKNADAGTFKTYCAEKIKIFGISKPKNYILIPNNILSYSQ
jgi:hypothetical protein